MCSCPALGAQVWVQQNKNTWSENSLLKEQLPYLSTEVMDLLDCMFELDENKRIDIKGGIWGQIFLLFRIDMKGATHAPVQLCLGQTAAVGRDRVWVRLGFRALT